MSSSKTSSIIPKINSVTTERFLPTPSCIPGDPPICLLSLGLPVLNSSHISWNHTVCDVLCPLLSLSLFSRSTYTIACILILSLDKTAIPFYVCHVLFCLSVCQLMERRSSGGALGLYQITVQITKVIWGRGDDSVNKVLDMQAWGPEFKCLPSPYVEVGHRDVHL